MPPKPTVDKALMDKIRQLIANNDIDLAIKELLATVSDVKLRDNVIQQAAKHAELKDLILNGTLNLEQINVGKAQIRYALLQVIANIEQGWTPARQKSGKMPPYLVPISLFVLALICLATIVYFLKCGGANQTNNHERLEQQTPVDKVDTSSISSNAAPAPSQGAAVPNQNTEGKVQANLPQKQYTTIEGQFLNADNKGVQYVNIMAPNHQPVVTDQYGLFKIAIEQPTDNPASHIYLYYSKDSLQGKELVKIGQKNVILRFKN